MASGKQQAAKTATAQARKPNLDRYYRYFPPGIRPGDYEFQLDLLRPRQKPMPINHMVDTLTWIDEQSSLNGTLTGYRADLEDPLTLPITRGHLIRCRVVWAGHRYQLWTMRCDAPQIETDTGQLTVTLNDDMALVDSGKRDWFFRATAARPFGYFAHDIAAEVARQLNVPIRRAAKGSKRMTFTLRNSTGLDVLKKAYANEKSASGHAFVIRLRNGAIEVVPIQRNPLLYVLQNDIQTAVITQKAGDKIPTTVLTGRGRINKGNATKAITFTEHDRKVVRALGYSHDTKDFGRVASHADLRAQVKRELANRLRMMDTVTVLHQGIPFILRGDGAQLLIPFEGYKGQNSYVYCTRAEHTVAAAAYTTSFDFTFTDPFSGQALPATKAAKLRKAKRTTRSRPKVVPQRAGHY